MDSVSCRVKKTRRPIKVLQYGEGAFLRGFADYFIDVANEKGFFNANIAVIKPVSFGSVSALKAQNCAYTVYMRGAENDAPYEAARVISCVEDAIDPYADYASYAAYAKNPDIKIIVSNSTEAGIMLDKSDNINLNPPNSFPGKLVKFLYDRFRAFKNDANVEDCGVIVLPCELVENNGTKLKNICHILAKQWDLPLEFIRFLEKANTFCNTLPDRIITGFSLSEYEEITNKLGYDDRLIVNAEPFALWVIEHGDPEFLSSVFPLDKAGLPVIFTKNITPYRERKVRLINGAHTSTALAAYLSGINTTFDITRDDVFHRFIRRALYCELAPQVPLPAEEARKFADSVMERMKNPYISHSLLSISLGSVPKFKERVLPTIVETYEKTGVLPPALTFSLAALMAFYSGDMTKNNTLIGARGGEKYTIVDDLPVLQFFSRFKDLPVARFVQALLRRDDFWGKDLSQVPALTENVAKYLKSINDFGARRATELVLRQIGGGANENA